MAADLAPVLVFTAGVASFFAPCILPVIPAYLSFVTGGPETARLARAGRTVSFVLGFSLAFVALGLLVGAVGASGILREYATWARWIGGTLIILFGLHTVGLLPLSFLDREIRYHGDPERLRKAPLAAAFALGGAFGIGWSPCVGPILASVLILAGSTSTVGASGLLLGIYAMGLAIPFLAIGFTADRGVAFVRRFRRSTRGIEIGGGVVLVLLGILVFTGATARFTSYLLPGGPNG